MSYLEWIEAHPGLASWVQGIGTLLAVIAALVAAAVAYRATIKAQEALAAQQQRAVAAALWAEMHHCRTQIVLCCRRLRDTKVRVPSMLPVEPLDTSIFDADPTRIGLLPSPAAYAVVQSYKAIRNADRMFRELRASESQGMSDDYASHVAGPLDDIINMIDVCLPRLAELAEVDPRAQAAIDEPLQKYRAAGN